MRKTPSSPNIIGKNEVGYKNLVKLTSLGVYRRMYSKYPALIKNSFINITKDYCHHLLFGCTGATNHFKKGEEEGENEFKWWLNIFQQDYYVELQRHGIPEQEKVNNIL